MRHAAADVTEELFPETLAMAGATLPLKYRFAPGHPLDGLTLTVPLALLNQLDDARLTWLVPGMVREKVTHYLKALPKALRNRLIPLPDVVTAFLEARAARRRRRCPTRCARWLERAPRRRAAGRRAGTTSTLPAHLAINVAVVDAAGAELASGRDLAALRAQLGEAAQLSFAAAGPAFERKGIAAWDFGDLPETLTITRDGAAADRLSGARRRRRQRVARAARYARGGRRGRRARGVVRLLRIALKDALARYDKGGRASRRPRCSSRRRSRPTGCSPTCSAAIATARSSATIRCRDREQAFAEQVQARAHAAAGGRRRRVPAARRRSPTGYQALAQRLAALPPALARLGGRGAGAARRARLSRVLQRHAVGAARAPAALPDGARPAARQVRRAARPRRAARRQVADVVAALRERRRARPRGRPRRAARSRLPLAARGAAGVAVRAGAEDPVPGVVQAAWKRPGRTLVRADRGAGALARERCCRHSGLALVLQ